MLSDPNGWLSGWRRGAAWRRQQAQAVPVASPGFVSPEAAVRGLFPGSV